MKTKTWAVLLAAAMLLCLLLSIPLLLPQSPAAFAEITSDGQIVRTVSLHQDQQFTVENGEGYNVITVKDGKIAVTEASCPDSYCMHRGYRDSGTQIVCLPNRLVITFLGDQEIDAAVG